MRQFIILISMMFFITTSYGTSKWKGILETGLSEFQKGQYNFAVTNLKKYLVLSGNNERKPEALYYLSLSYYFENNYTQAMIVLDELISRYKMSDYGIQGYFWQGLIYQSDEDWKAAEESFLRYLNVMPTSDLADRATLAVANCRFELKKYVQAIDILRTIVLNEKSEQYEDASVLYAYILFITGKTTEAIDFLEPWVERIKIDEKNYRLKDRFWLYLAELYSVNKKENEAYLLYKNIDNYSSGSPSSDIALLRLSEIETRRGNDDVAKEYSQRLLIEYPNSMYVVDSLINSAIPILESGDYKEASHIFNTILADIAERSLKPNSSAEKKRIINQKSRVLILNAQALIGLNQKALALKQLKIIINDSLPFYNEAYLKAIELHIESGEISEAGLLIDEFEKKYPGDIDDHFILMKASYLTKTGSHNDSNFYLDRIDEKSLVYTQALSLKATNNIQKKDYIAALAILQKQLVLVSINEKAFIAYTMMEVQLNQKLYIETIRLYDAYKVYTKNLDKKTANSLNLRADYIVGLAFMQLKRYEEGIQKLNNVIQQEKIIALDIQLAQIIFKSYYYAGWMQYKISDYNSASAYFLRASEGLTDDVMKKDSYFMNAYAYYSAGNFAESSKRFITFYRNFPKQSEAAKSIFYAAKGYLNLGNISESKKLFAIIFEQYRGHELYPDSLFELIKIAYLEKDSDVANNYINIFVNTLKTHTLLPSVLMQQIQFFASKERHSETLSASLYFINSVSDMKGFDYVYYQLGYSALKIKDYQTAIKYTNEFLSSFPESSYRETTIINLIAAYRMNGDNLKERDQIESFLKQYKDNNGEYKTRLAVLDRVLSGESESEAMLKVKAEKGDSEAMYSLGILLYKKGEFEKGIYFLEQLQKKSDKNGEYAALANNFFADIEFDKGKYKEALQLYTATISRFTTNEVIASEALYKTAYCYYTLNAFEQAKKVLLMLEQKYPENRWKANTEALLRSMK